MRRVFAFNKKLFWDVPVASLDYEKHAAFIIERILNMGDERDYRALKKIYDEPTLRSAVKGARYTSKKNMYFWGLVFNIPPTSLRCIRKFSTRQPSAFLNRS